MERNLNIRLILNEDGSIRAEVQDNESGLHATIENNYSPDEHPEFDADIGEELYSWLALMADEMKLENNVPTAFDLRAIQLYEPTDVVLNVCWFGEKLELIKRSATAAEWFSDWCGKCEMCPPNDTPIFTVSASTVDGNGIGMVFIGKNGKDTPIFEDLMKAIRPCMVYQHWDSNEEAFVACEESSNSGEPRYFIGMDTAFQFAVDNNIPDANVVECLGICPNCGQPVFHAREPGVWGKCFHCDTCFAGPEDISEA